MSKIYSFTPEQLKIYTEMCKGNTDQLVDVEKLTPHIIVTTMYDRDYYCCDDREEKGRIWTSDKKYAIVFPTFEKALKHPISSSSPVRFEPVYPKNELKPF